MDFRDIHFETLSFPSMRTFLLALAISFLVLGHSFAESAFKYPLPNVDESNFNNWMEFIEPSQQEMAWNQLRWHDSLELAVAEAKRLNRPILLWVMNGHPCGEV